MTAAKNGNPKRSVEELAAHVLGCRPLEIYFRDITSEQESELEVLIARAETGEPIQYIVGHVDFRGLEIACDSRALIPRPETELLVDQVLSSIGNRQSAIDIVDVCTGTGCIGLALAHELPNANVTAIDISPEALALACENAERLGLVDRFQTLESDLLSCFLGAEIKFDIVVSNPPYIFSSVLAAPEPNGEGGWKTLEESVRKYEPRIALDGGEDGMDLIRPLVEQAARVLKPGGSLFLEIGYDQGQAVFQCLEKAGFKNIRIIKDHAGHDRIVAGFKE